MGTGTKSGGDRFIVTGGRRLSGVVRPSGNKNEALPAIAAALLAPGVTVLENVPKIRDVLHMLDSAASVGAVITWIGPNEVSIDATEIRTDAPKPEIASVIRGSFLLAAPLLHRKGHARLPRPGGDKIGRRRLDTHLIALEALKAKVHDTTVAYDLSLPFGRFISDVVFLDEASVMATENALMAAAVADGESFILNAASEPHVQGLAKMLVSMGAKIEGIGTNRLRIEGAPNLNPTRHRLGADHIEVGSFMAIAAMTGGEIRIPDVDPEHFRMIRHVFRRLGVVTHFEDVTTLVVPARQPLEVQSDVDGSIVKVDDAPWPGFPADLTSLIVVLATQCKGTVLVHEKLFESRLFFVDNLLQMGAKIVLCDPHRAVVVGPSRLHAAEMASPDIRAGMALIAAALCADGKSVIQNAAQVDRGYERIEERLRALGADIERVTS